MNAPLKTGKQGLTVCLGILLLLTSCRQETTALPKDLISREKMIQVLADVHITEAAIYYKNGHGDKVDNKAPEYYQYIFSKQGITEKQFRESFDYYLHQEAQLDKIYEDVITEISRRQAETVSK